MLFTSSSFQILSNISRFFFFSLNESADQFIGFLAIGEPLEFIAIGFDSIRSFGSLMVFLDIVGYAFADSLETVPFILLLCNAILEMNQLKA